MPRLVSKYFGELDYPVESVFEFPSGIPAFENHNQFVFLEQPDTRPLVLMQSSKDPALCFILIPVFVAEPNYELHILLNLVYSLSIMRRERSSSGWLKRLYNCCLH